MRQLFTNEDIADYYNSTQNHYVTWWGLRDHLSLHYGIWEKGIRNFGESVRNTNRVLFDLANVQSADRILDAGCGVGGAALYIHERCGADVVGITLSEKQVDLAKTMARSNGLLENGLHFHIMDFTDIDFEDDSFDVIWACESVCHTKDKADFFKECFRLLRKGGRLVMSDFFVTDSGKNDPKRYMRKWQDTWGVDNYQSIDEMRDDLGAIGFEAKVCDYTHLIQKSAERMFYAALVGAISSRIYNLFHPKVSRFARNHYKCGYYQYKALKAGLWKYAVIRADK